MAEEVQSCERDAKTPALRRIRHSIGARWPKLKYLSLAFYSAWILLAVSSDEAVSALDAATAGSLQGMLYLSSGVALTACLFVFGALSDIIQPHIERGPLVTAMGAMASICTFILMGGFGASIGLTYFVACGIGTGIGTSFVCLRVGFVTSRLNGVEAALTVGLAALVANLLFFTCQALPKGAALSIISLLPILAALSSFCVESDEECGPEVDDLIDIAFLPKGYFLRLVCTVFVFALAAGVAKGIVATMWSSELFLGAKQSTWEVLISFVVVGIFMLGVVVLTAYKNIDLSRIYVPVGFATAVGMLLCPVLGGFMQIQGIVVNVLYNVFILVVWCWLIELAGRTTLGPVRVFGFGRGASALATTLGWALVVFSESFVEDPTTVYTGFFLAMAFALLTMMALVLSERTVSEALAKTVALETGAKIKEPETQENGTGVVREDPWARACQEIAEEANLTSRESEVFALLSRGRSISYIASELVIAPNTVKGYTKNIYAKVGIHSRQELIDLTEMRITAVQE